MDVILLNGGIAYRPILMRSIGPYKIAHWLRKYGYQCQVIDHVLYFNADQLYTTLKKFITPDTKIIGLSTTFICNNAYKHSDGRIKRIPEFVLNVLSQIKLEHPSIRFVMGGYISDRLPNWDVFDVTIMSYLSAPEEIFLEYLDWLSGRGTEPVFEKKRNSIGTGFEDKIIYSAARNPKYNIETDDFKFIPTDVILPNEPLPLDVSRGCIFTCRFCQYPHLGKHKLDYVRAMEHISAELSYNFATFGSTSYYIIDDTFNDTEWKLRSFHSAVSKLPFKIRFSAYLRADLLNHFDETPYILKESGLVGAYHGLESLHKDASKIIGKGWNGNYAREYIPYLFHNIWNKSVAQHCNFIVGLPYEKETDVYGTVNWFIENNLHSIGFDLLGLYGVDNSASPNSIFSEFDKNPQKYGFSFEADPINFNGTTMNWKNCTWTVGEAYRVTQLATKMTREFSKTRMWSILALLWQGYDLTYLMTTPQEQLSWDDIKASTLTSFDVYFNKLMLL